jgi:3-isopropylmalate/(R)-2-methylmalate dehydratase small subunit
MSDMGSNALGGTVWKFGDNINTDLILPGPYLYRSAADQATAVFMNNRPEFLARMRKGDVVVGGANFGMGSSRPAARSLRNCGVGFVLAEAINGLFFRNCVNYGFRAFECPGVTAAFDEGDRAELSIDDWTATNIRTGQVLAVKPVPTVLLDMMLGGGVLPMLEARGLIARRGASGVGGVG